MSIATSIEKLSETLTNCKTNLKEKEVADVDNIKISDVDEKIAEIQAGGGGNQATVTFSVGEGNKGDFYIYGADNHQYIFHSGEIYGKCVIDIAVENSPYDMDNDTLGNSIRLSGITKGRISVAGEIKDRSGTITITVENGLGYPAEAYADKVVFEPFLFLVLRESTENLENFETHVLFAQCIN